MTSTVAFLLLAIAVFYTTAHVIVPEQNFEDCGPNEYFNECGTLCQPSCKDPNPTQCVYKCFIGCQCKDGYVRHDTSKKCVLTRNCPKFS